MFQHALNFHSTERRENVELDDHCAYCQTPRLFGHRMRHRSIDTIAKYAEFLKDIILGAEKCLEHGFTPVVDFIFGIPMETEEDQLETQRLIKYLTGKGGKIHSHYFMPIPGTELENSAPTKLSKKINKIMSELALHGKATGGWFKV